MKPLPVFLFFLFIILILTSCATIVSKSSWPLMIRSKPESARVEITDKDKLIVFTGKTPAFVCLKSGAGFFQEQSYMVKLTSENNDERMIPVKCELNSWYFGNVLFGGIIGMLIVDPATGAMYKLDKEYINVSFIDSSSQSKGAINTSGISTNSEFKNSPNNAQESSGNQGFKIGDKVKIRTGFKTIQGRIVEVKENSVIVGYEKNGEMNKKEILKKMIEE